MLTETSHLPVQKIFFTNLIYPFAQLVHERFGVLRLDDNQPVTLNIAPNDPNKFTLRQHAKIVVASNTSNTNPKMAVKISFSIFGPCFFFVPLAAAFAIIIYPQSIRRSHKFKAAVIATLKTDLGVVILITAEFSRFRIVHLLTLKAFTIGPAGNHHTLWV